jgi:ribosome biogenesis GTPase / thiamine phosphate phosphatase
MAKLGDDLRPARIVGQHRREWDVASETGSTRAVLAGKRWDPERAIEAADAQPTIGDWVAIRPGDPPVIESILNRRTWLARTSVTKRGAKQMLVANIDIVAVVAAFAQPDSDDATEKRGLNPRRIERYLLAITKGGAQPLVLLNKSDLDADAQEKARSLEERLQNCPVRTVNCRTQEGLAGLWEFLTPGKTVGFVGLSGVGKSSIVNALLKREAQTVGEERSSDARGRHTTTARELFLAREGFILIDTPGMREFALAGPEDADLDAFSEITEMALMCQFRDCAHRNEPGCRVRDAVGRGEISADRLASFHALKSELGTRERERPAWKKPEAGRQKRAPSSGKGRRNSRAEWDEG